MKKTIKINAGLTNVSLQCVKVYFFRICAVGIICKASIAVGQTISTAGPEALGGAGRATTNTVDSHYLNPAAIAFSQDFKVGTFFQMARPQLENPGNTYGVVVTDNSPDNFFGGSLGYAYRRSSTPTNVIIEQDYSAVLAGRIVPSIAVGVSGRRLVRQNSNGPSWTKHNATAGVIVVPQPFLGFAFVAYDMINDDDLDMVPKLALGAHAIMWDILRIRADVTRQEKLNPEKLGALHLGMEIASGYGIYIRTGGEWDAFHRTTMWTGGLAWEGPNLSLAYSARNNVNVAGDLTHTMQAWLNF